MERCVRQSIFGCTKLFPFVLLVLLVVCACGTSALAATTTYSVSGSVKAGGTGVPGIHVNLAGGTVNKTLATDTHGNYNFTNIAAESYTITPSGNGCTFSPPSYSSVTIPANPPITYDFTVTFGISGKVTVSGQGDPSGVIVTLSGAAGQTTTTTDPNGNYSFSPLPKGVYTITPTKLAYTFSPSYRSVSIKSAGSIAANFVAKEVTYTISGTAATGNPIANAPVDLVDSAGPPILTAATTSSSGHFSLHPTGIKPPFMLRVQTSSGPLYSVSSNWNASATINITPLTDIIIRSWYGAKGVEMAAAFADPLTYPPPTPTDVLVLRTMVQNTVQTWLQAAGVKTAGFNAISTPFAANGKGVDAVFNLITETLLDGGKISVTINGNPSSESGGIQNMAVAAPPNPTTQNTTFDPSNGSNGSSLTVTTTPTVAGYGDGSTTTTTSVVPNSSEEEDALAGINTTITNFVNTVNKKGHSLQTNDLLPYIASDYLDNGMYGSDWAAGIVSQMAGVIMSFSGLQINSLSANVANVSFQVTAGNQTNIVTTNFELVSSTWLVSGNGYIAQFQVEPWAWDHPNQDPQFTNSTEFSVYDVQQNNVQSVTVSGPGLGTQDNPQVDILPVCDYVQPNANNLPLCGNSHGPDNTQRAFELYKQPFWPQVGSTYTFTLTTANGGPYTYTYTVGNEYGFDSSTPPVQILADYPIVTLTNPSSLTLSQILNGVTVTGSVYIPIWAEIQGHFGFEGPGGESNNVSNIDIPVHWSGTVIPGQYNTFIVTIPKSTNVTPVACNGGGTGPCYNITFQGQTGDIEAGWFGFDTIDSTVSYGSATNNGVEINQ